MIINSRNNLSNQHANVRLKKISCRISSENLKFCGKQKKYNLAKLFLFKLYTPQWIAVNKVDFVYKRGIWFMCIASITTV